MDFESENFCIDILFGERDPEQNMAKLLDVPPVSALDVTGEQSNLSQKWTKWKKQFEYYINATGVTDKNQKRALLLHLIGQDAQDIFETFTDTGDDFDNAIAKFDEYFLPRKNTAYERRIFRMCKQTETESIDAYVTRLKTLAKTCEFGDMLNDALRDQVIDQCRSSKLRRRLLRERDLTLEKLQEIARANEASEQQAAQYEDLPVRVNAIKNRKEKETRHYNKKIDSKYKDLECHRCGNIGHFARDCTITKDKTCHKCGKKGHFAKKCKSKRYVKYTGHETRREKVRYMDEDSTDSEEYVFALDRSSEGRITLRIGSTVVPFLVDSGATCNIINSEVWDVLRKSGVRKIPVSKQLFAYGATKPLDIKSKISSEISCDESKMCVMADFLLVEGNHAPLLGRDTASKLEILFIGPKVNMIHSEKGLNSKSDIMRKFPDVFSGLGKLKDYQLKIHVDENVKPIAQPVRRLPFNIRKSVELKLKEFEELDVIERVHEPSKWVSPLVVVPKKNGEIRICVDMRRANEAIVRERHPIPTVDEILQELNGATVFSKIDLRWGFHQIELEPESRNITTFTTHAGLYRYKRLMFGVSCAPEMYQQCIQMALFGCEGQRNISDDVIVYGKTQMEHDAYLEKVLERMREKGLKLNADKCKFNMDKLTFMGHVLSANGVSPDESKVEAVTSARNPQNATELRSFLGLVNYCARYIPNFSTISAPLRELTKSRVKWDWNKRHQDAFEELKRLLASAKTLAYYDKEAETQVIVDASPVGLGGILSQKQKDGNFRPVMFASRTLTDVETRYSQTEREALAVVWGCERFHLYLYAKEFTLITDHKPLEIIFSPKSKPPPRIERWAMRLMQYKFKVQYKPGPQNAADFLSRLSQVKGQTRNIGEEYAYFVSRNAVPNAMTFESIQEESKMDKDIKQILNGKISKSNQYFRFRDEMSVVDGVLMRGMRIVIPSKLRKQTLELAHEGHQGIVKTKLRLREKVWWPGIDKDVETVVRACKPCQLVGPLPKQEPVKPTPLPNGPWQDLCADLMGPFPTGEYVFVVVDYYSRWQEVAVLKSVTTEKIVRELDIMFCRHGIPNSMKTDNGPQFKSTEFADYMRENGIKHNKSTPYWPQANGEVERQNRTLLKAFRAANAESRDWRKEIPKFLLAYRSTPHSTTGKSPAEMLFNRKIRTKLPEIIQDENKDDIETRKRDTEMKEKGKVYADHRRKTRESNVEVGDIVLQKQSKQNKLSTNFEQQPYRVIKKEGSKLTLENGDGTISQRNTSFVKPLIGDTENIESDNYENGEILDDCETAQQSDEERRPTRNRKLPERFKDYVMY